MATPPIGLQVNFVTLVPTLPAQVPNGALFIDSTNGNMATVKAMGGATSSLENPATSLLTKKMQIAAPIPAKRPVSKQADGKIVEADSDAVDGQKVVGFTLAEGENAGDLVDVLCVGPNLSGALTGLGFSIGDNVFVSETGGYTNDLGSFTGGNDSIIRVGIADCAAGSASSVATDLILFPQVMLRP